MSAAYVTDPPKARFEGDVLWLDLRSGKETMSFALTRNATLHLFQTVNREVPRMFDEPQAEIVPFEKQARKPRAKAVRS
ncbi:hypothetical protein EWE75_13575 [Sphingomonas populi]|uniref:Uncharacterized protein n=1 Tax=Sphingomonas populi TaxID=2484750 RepID=A0A4Q6XVN9_9SPHN|nr:hypothetical protein [Sphingomonas populi]RZF64001.1 hypothetical protein EWE75_13575 [Sphingomonas populi]